MKTLKLFVLTSLLVAFAFSTTSCSKKDDDNNSSIDYKKEIVGTWKVVKMVSYKNGEVERTVDLNSDEDFSIRLAPEFSTILLTLGSCLSLLARAFDELLGSCA